MNCLSLTSLPNELFFRATLGDFEIKCTGEAIKTLSQISLTCKAANEIVNRVWNQIILHSGLIDYLFPSSRTNAPNNPKEFLKSNYPVIKKWSHVDLQKWRTADPQVNESRIRGCMEQCVLNNNQGHPELWIMWGPRTNLWCVDLMTQKEGILPLEEKSHPVSRRCHPCMALSDSWIAICCEEQSNEIVIIDKLSGIRLHTIADLGQVLKVECEGNYLYVLCKLSKEEYTFMQYDSCDWKAVPKALCLPRVEIYTFFIGVEHIVFSTTSKLFAISKQACFVNKVPIFITQALLEDYYYYKIQFDEGGFYTLIKKNNSVEVAKLYIENSEIHFIIIQTLPLSLFTIRDFNVQRDKIFIVDNINSVLCYNLIDGQLMKEFPSKATEAYGTNFRPTLVTSEPKRIQFLFSSIVDIAFAGTSLLTLNYAKV